MTRPVRQLRTAAALLAAAMLAACGGADEQQAAAKRAVRVGIVFDIGGRGDGGFNDGAAAGAAAAEQAGGVTVAYADVPDGAARDAALERFARDGMDLVVVVGFLGSGPATRLASAHPGVKFAVMDYAIPTDSTGRAVLPPENLAAVTFREEEGAYLVGAAAGQVTRTKVVGYVGGMNSAMIRRFEAGYAAGVARVCPECRVLSNFAGDTPEAFRSPEKGRALALAQYGAGADVIFQAAGGTGNGVFAAARETGRRVIGVDIDQSSQAPGLTVTSMLKRIDVAVQDMIERTARGEFRGGFQSYGLAEGGLGYVAGAQNAALLPADRRQRVEVLREAIVAGLLTVPTTR